MAPKYYSLEEVSKNNGKDGNKLWLIYDHSVIDVTDYQHPGGNNLLLEYGGKDATEAFNNVKHSNDAKEELNKRKIGEIRKEHHKNVQSNVATAGTSGKTCAWKKGT